MPIAAIAMPRAMRANACTGFVTEDVMWSHSKNSVSKRRGRATYSIIQSSLCKGHAEGVAGRLESSTAASRANDRFQVIEELLQRKSAGRGQPVISPWCLV